MNDSPDKNTVPLFYKFSNEIIIQAESEEQAEQIFASNSYNFAADAECEVYTTNRINSKKEGV